jgi:hypothetical protein
VIKVQKKTEQKNPTRKISKRESSSKLARPQQEKKKQNSSSEQGTAKCNQYISRISSAYPYSSLAPEDEEVLMESFCISI